MTRMAPVRTFPAIQNQEEAAEYFQYLPMTSSPWYGYQATHQKKLEHRRRNHLGGTGSAHEGIDELIGEALEIKTSVIHPLDEVFLGNVNLPEGINAQVLTRIIGMGKRFLLAERSGSVAAPAKTQISNETGESFFGFKLDVYRKLISKRKLKTLYAPLKALMRSNIGK